MLFLRSSPAVWRTCKALKGQMGCSVMRRAAVQQWQAAAAREVRRPAAHLDGQPLAAGEDEGQVVVEVGEGAALVQLCIHLQQRVRR